MRYIIITSFSLTAQRRLNYVYEATLVLGFASRKNYLRGCGSGFPNPLVSPSHRDCGARRSSDKTHAPVASVPDALFRSRRILARLNPSPPSFNRFILT
jgi:hypothetical protein